MSKFTLIPANQLKTVLVRIVKASAKLHDDLHRYAVSAIHHAARTGDVRPLNAFYDGALTPNYQTSLKLYLRRTFIENPTANCIDFKNKAFEIGGSDPKARAALAKLCEDKLLNPDGETFKRFYERENIVETILMDDKRFAQQLKTLLNKAKGQSDRVEAHVSRDLVTKLENLVVAAEAHAEQADLKAARAKPAARAA